MRIVNKNLAGKELRKGGRVYQGDAHGVFEVDDAHAEALLTTRGWEPAKTARKPAVVAAAPAVVSRVPPPPSAPAAPAAEPPPSEASEPAAEEGPDLDALTTKDELIAVADKYEVKLTAKQRKGSVDELRAAIDQSIYGED